MDSSRIPYLTCCLYFTANSLSRTITEMAKETFTITGLDPSYAHLMLLISHEPGLPQNEIANIINLKPSSLTRMLDELERKSLIERMPVRRSSLIYLTKSGEEEIELIQQALNKLYDKYCSFLGEDFAVKLTADIVKANEKLK